MNSEAAKVIEIAKREIGTKEKPVNVQKYSEYFDNLRKEGVYVYNYPKQSVAWCDIFVDFCFAQAFGPVEGMKKLYQPMKGAGAGCKFSAQFYRDHGAFYPYPMEGDQVFFGPSGAETHTGLVTRVTKNKFYTIEGNSSDMVKEHSYSLPSKKVSGFGRPNYAVEALEPTKPTTKYDYPKLPDRGYFVKGDRGAEVQKLQKILLAVVPACLPKYGIDGIVGNEVWSAIYYCQSKLNVAKDHLFGPKTLAACKRYLER